MRLNGIHHISAITADAQRNVDFYTRVLGLRLVKKSVNQDEPTVYHLFYGDEHGSPGADLTFFEYPGAVRGRAGSGMLYRILWRVAGDESLDFWQQRLSDRSIQVEREAGWLRFRDPEGLEHELVTRDDGNPPLAAHWHEIPDEHALLGFAGARAYAADPSASTALLTEVLEFEQVEPGEYLVQGPRRSATFGYDQSSGPGKPGAGTIHHIAWWSEDDDHEEWQRRVAKAGAQPTPVIDRHYFRSVYFFEPSRVLFELATTTPGFAVDEPVEHLGERLSLPPKFEPLRGELETQLTPLDNPRAPARA